MIWSNLYPHTEQCFCFPWAFLEPGISVVLSSCMVLSIDTSFTYHHFIAHTHTHYYFPFSLHFQTIL